MRDSYMAIRFSFHNVFDSLPVGILVSSKENNERHYMYY